MDVTRITDQNAARASAKTTSASSPNSNTNSASFFKILNGMRSGSTENEPKTAKRANITDRQETFEKSHVKKTSADTDDAAKQSVVAGIIQIEGQQDQSETQVTDVSISSGSEVVNEVAKAGTQAAKSEHNTRSQDNSSQFTVESEQAQSDAVQDPYKTPNQQRGDHRYSVENPRQHENNMRFSAQYSEQFTSAEDSLRYLNPNVNIVPPDTVEGVLEDQIGKAADLLNTLRVPDDIENEMENPIIGNQKPVDFVSHRRQETTTAIVENISREERTTTETRVTSYEAETSGFSSNIKTKQNKTVENASEAASSMAQAGIRAPERSNEFAPVEEIAQRTSEQTSQASQIYTEVIRNLENQKMEFRMQLQPEDLGQIDIKMGIQGGKLAIEILSSARTSEILSRQIDNLVAAIRQNSPELSSVQVVTQTHAAPGNMTGAFNMNGRDQEQATQNAGHNNRGFKNNGSNDEPDDNDMEVDTGRLLNYEV